MICEDPADLYTRHLINLNDRERNAAVHTAACKNIQDNQSNLIHKQKTQELRS